MNRATFVEVPGLTFWRGRTEIRNKRTTMKRIWSLLAFGWIALTGLATAQETNSYPQSHLETFEATTGVVMIRSTDELGFVAGKTGSVSVRCREAREVGGGRRAYGALVTVTASDNVEDTTVVDYDELDAVIRAMDYTGKVDWSVTPLSHFEAAYITRSGLKVATYSSRRSGTVEAFALSNRQMRCRSNLTTAQFSQLRVLLEQTKARIEILMREK
jgi:hypothetical protein